MTNLSYRTNTNAKHNLFNLNKCISLLKNNLPLIGEGYESKIYKVESDNCGSIVLKIFKQQTQNSNDDIKSLNKEVKMLIICNNAINNFNCPNFIQLYQYNFKEKYLLTEYFDGESSYLFDDTFYKQKIYDTYIIQFLMGLFFLEMKGYRHGDFKPNNILYKNIEKILFHYKIDTLDFYIPTYGKLYAVMDFGRTYSTRIKTDKNDIKSYVDKINRTIRHNNIKKYLQKYKTIDEFLDIFSKDKQEEIQKNSTYDNTLSSYISYALKKDYIKSENENLNKYVYELKNILNGEISLRDILLNNFEKYKIYKKKYDKYKIIEFNL